MKPFFTILILAAALTVQAQSPDSSSRWKRSVQAGMFFNQASFSNNWKSGGVNTVSYNALLNAKASYTDGDFEWANDLQLQYGNVNSKGTGKRKNFDRIFFESKVSHRFNKAWRAFGSVTFMSQFDKGYDYKKDIGGADSVVYISSFMAPAYLTEALGMEYKPVDYFSAQFGVGALRQTFVTNQTLYAATNATTLYGVERGENFRNQVVFQFVADFDKEIIKNIVLKARYLAVIDYANLSGQGIVHRLDASLVAKVNKYINVNLGTVVLYDHDQDNAVQYSQVLGIGLLYTFTEFEK